MTRTWGALAARVIIQLVLLWIAAGAVRAADWPVYVGLCVLTLAHAAFEAFRLIARRRAIPPNAS